MKYIHIIITTVDCKEVEATAVVFDNCLNREICNEVSYPVNADEYEIAEIILPNITDFKMSFAHIGGGGIKRAKS